MKEVIAAAVNGFGLVAWFAAGMALGAWGVFCAVMIVSGLTILWSIM